MGEQVKEKVTIPMVPLDHRQEPYAPGYSSSYTPQPYKPASYIPESHKPDPYLPEPSTADSYGPSSNSTCCGRESCYCDCPSPPPYSCQEVPCDRVEPINMDSCPPVVVAGIFSSKPASTICPCCRQIITTEVVYRVGSLTYAACCTMCMMGCCMGCCLIPFMTKCCKDVDHYCPKCQYHIYRYKRL